MAFADMLVNIWFWICMTGLFFVMFMGLFFLLFWLARKTHCIIELKAFIKKQPLAIFFNDNRYCDFKAVKVEGGVIEDKNYGTFIMSERGSYIDKKTKLVILPFDENLAPSLNIAACKATDEVKHFLKEENNIETLRQKLWNNEYLDKSFDCIRSSVNLGSIKYMMNAMLPHAITSKINMTVAQKIKGWAKVNAWEYILIFLAILGAIVVGYILIKSVGR